MDVRGILIGSVKVLKHPHAPNHFPVIGGHAAMAFPRVYQFSFALLSRSVC